MEWAGSNWEGNWMNVVNGSWNEYFASVSHSWCGLVRVVAGFTFNVDKLGAVFIEHVVQLCIVQD